MFDWGAEGGLAALFAAAFLSATLLPANSEVVLAALLQAHPERLAAAIAVATLGNTLGGLATYGLGRLLPQRSPPTARSLRLVQRHGAMALLLSWVPLIGDALCLAAGWLRVAFWPSLAAIAAGKLARYLVVGLAAVH